MKHKLEKTLESVLRVHFNARIETTLKWNSVEMKKKFFFEKKLAWYKQSSASNRIISKQFMECTAIEIKIMECIQWQER